METKTYKIVKNYLWPFPSTIEIGSDGILSKGKLISWNSIEGFSHHIIRENSGTIYSTVLVDHNKKYHNLAILAGDNATDEKKQLFAEIYSTIAKGLTEFVLVPKVKSNLKLLKSGRELILEKAVVTNKGIQVRKGMLKKETVFIPLDEIRIEHTEGAGGFKVFSSVKYKDAEFFSYEGGETRFLLATLEAQNEKLAEIYY